ncbi:MAG: SRPBCC domain-containing protein [Acidimicrobiia bacterium]|nr:SRPBCC domain-containing protein [Acidimicrobiia bacterium]
MTTTDNAIAPVEKHRTVPIAREAAFALFTSRMGEWWPAATYSIHGADLVSIRFDEHVGGRISEIGPDGTEIPWADVLAWNPPERFVVSWHPNPEPVAASILEVRFEVSPEGTLVTLEHRGWEEFGDSAHRLRDDYDSGWEVVLAQFERAAGL